MEDFLKAVLALAAAAATQSTTNRVPEPTKIGGIDVYLADPTRPFIDPSVAETARLVRSIANEVAQKCRSAWSDSQRRFYLDMHKSSKQFRVVGFGGGNKLSQAQFDHIYNTVRIGAVSTNGYFGVGCTDLAGNTYVAYPR